MSIDNAANPRTAYVAPSPSVIVPTQCSITAAYGEIPIVLVEYAHAKRILDILVALVALLVLSPVFAVVALLVRVTSKGPVIFRQTRVGRGGQHFTLFKFRTMHPRAEELKYDIAHLNEISGPVFKVKDDPRVTPIGRVLRKFSIDELPQFFNVLLGDMTLVGPRPPLPSEVSLYGAHEKRRLSVHQGLTCFWQVFGRHNIAFERWVELDIAYINTMTFWGDVSLVLMTIPAVLTAKGSY